MPREPLFSATISHQAAARLRASLAFLQQIILGRVDISASSARAIADLVQDYGIAAVNRLEEKP